MAQTGVPRSTLRALFAEYKKNGHILRTKESAYEMRGQKRKLTTANVGVLILAKFLTGNIRQRNDLYLDELQDLVSSHLGISVDDSTIWRTLHRQGFTMKKLIRSTYINSKQGMGIERAQSRKEVFLCSWPQVLASTSTFHEGNGLFQGH
ncbi:hypothetical protein C8R41DRAFT_868110 [Lentinula lateritia]|uniref:Winged helix-turn helix domain-containing protein n=1 Tax=Lentinula lateritia TaxID=40482 RepID=A0ABQ8VC82_9AGAR|nr:hypothetical protein C8R41DRAFT_868110 [Lentinula lateritia]